MWHCGDITPKNPKKEGITPIYDWFLGPLCKMMEAEGLDWMQRRALKNGPNYTMYN